MHGMFQSPSLLWRSRTGLKRLFVGCVLLATGMVTISCASLALPTPQAFNTPSRPTVLPVPTPQAESALTAGSSAPSTATALATHTPTPTSTLTPTPSLLTQSLGVSHALISQLESEGYTAGDHQVTTVQGERFVAAILLPPTQSDSAPKVNLPRLTIFHVLAGQPAELLFEDEGSDEEIQFAGYGTTWNTPIGWSDLTADGLLELPIWANNGGPCFACTRIYVLQLLPSDTTPDQGWQIRELTGAFPFLNLVQTPMVPKLLSDYNNDQVAEVEVLDARFEFGFGLDRAQSPRLYRYWVWDDTQYRDASANSPAYFNGQIARARAAVESTYGQPLPGPAVFGQAITVLLAYEASGRREEGWAVFDLLSAPSNWNGEAWAGLLDWLRQIRNYVRGQYERGEPFAAWPPLSPPPVPAEEPTVSASAPITPAQAPGDTSQP